MKLLKFLLVLSLLVAGGSAFAGEEPAAGSAEGAADGSWSSGGGSAVACFTSPEVAAAVAANRGMVTTAQLSFLDSIEVLDLFEWKRPRGLNGRRQQTLAEPRPGENYVNFLHRVIQRAGDTIGQHSSQAEAGLANHLWAMEIHWSDLLSQNVIWTGTSLVHLADEETPMRFGGNCALVPMAVQEGEKYQLRLFVDDRLFFHPKHSEQSRAALMLHEMVYAMARRFGHKDSSATRQAVGLLLQNDSMRIQDLHRHLVDLGFHTKIPGLKKMPYSGIKLISVLSNLLSPDRESFRRFWEDRSFRAEPSSKDEATLVTEAEKLLAREGRHFPDGMNANRAWAYLEGVNRADELRAELDVLIKARAASLRKTYADRLGENPFQENLERFSYLDGKLRGELQRLCKTGIVDRLVALAERRVTDEQLAALHAENAEEFHFPIFVPEEIWAKNNSDGHFSRWSYWFHESLYLEMRNAQISLYDLRVPAL